MFSADSGLAPGVIAIVRLPEPVPDAVLDSVVAGGVRAIEVTANTPGAFDTVARWRACSDVLVGVGTVRTVEGVGRAVDAGAQFIVTPTLVAAVLTEARQAGIPVVCGALSPTEIDCAWQHGATAVKVFPVDAAGGPRYVAALQAPLGDVPLVPTGGVDPSLTREYAALGCVGVGVGSALVAADVVRAGSWDTLERRAAAFAEAWSAGGGA
ncbi:bifunctional 4-hydroxy-2-oxoglutarate aldolase/2-dehydro-3-deoxy-phosphogluconate aldolase [Georgenia satyanarayanai]|uniref:bifunctional 4-hydroxy-2-oxoglutarate aldolase/2-dehydro-3-deoxy-phosphogluconate aldolase n=1 Tax=Georgenia satyanarayanai TaxID=860221 RepID=UPI0020408330|nr:bifunctional 4-hydroxy-2-oxoglutarate aldolase/2-dehydro-3-deoxy-phosphogluconate aldolase [Georgenia satyanarayanai]MCM3659779.1 bifunctional 4-hydroxy-2-oxoglutarate aldolase/2-dehydro-3-deoxy-phosphogluconate aldolase [Georgenia satyanarayanai]